MTWRNNPWALAGALLAGTIAVGAVSFLLSGLIGPKTVTQASRLTPDRLFEMDGGPARLLSLQWGSGSGSSVNETLQYVFISDDYVCLADLDPKALAPRVRWFDVGGTLRGSYLCPVGATNFAPFEGGFSFIVAPGASGSDEQAALYSFQGSQLTTFTVPSSSSGAGVLENQGALYVQVDDSVFDVRAQTVTIEGRLVPVAERGRQLDEATSREGIVDARYLGENGRLYNRRIEAKAGEPDSQTQIVRDVETSAAVQVPPFGEFLGVDGAGLGYVRVPGERTSSPPETAGVARKSDAITLVLVAEMSGDGQWVLPVESPHPFPYARRLLSVSRDGLVASRATSRGVDVLLYRRSER